MPQQLHSRGAKIAASISLLAVTTSSIATAFFVWLRYVSNYLDRTPPDAAWGVAIGFLGTVLPALAVGLVAAYFSGEWKGRLVVLNAMFLVLVDCLLLGGI